MASALNAARATFEQQVKDGWVAAGYDATAISWPNVTFTPPGGEDALWLQVTGLWGDAFAETMGARGTGLGINQVVGVLHLNLFAHAGTGTGALMVAADAVRDVVNRLEVGGVRFDAASGPARVSSPDPTWEQVAVQVPFTVEETV